MRDLRQEVANRAGLSLRTINAPENLVALCQRWDLSLQASFLPGQTVVEIARPAWMTTRGLRLGPRPSSPAPANGPNGV